MVKKDKSFKNSSTKKRKKSSKKTPLINKPPTMHEDPMQETNEILEFDLARQIMAEHRKITAVKRKGPGKKSTPVLKNHPAELIARNVYQDSSALGPEQIIAEIVARDIENVCLGKTP